MGICLIVQDGGILKSPKEKEDRLYEKKTGYESDIGFAGIVHAHGNRLRQ